MPKGFKLPESSKKKPTMRAGSPKKQELKSRASSMSSKVPELRPSWKKNLSGWSGFKPGSY